jgi:hypothetical protein
MRRTLEAEGQSEQAVPSPAQWEKVPQADEGL